VKVNREKTENNQAFLTIEVDAEEMEESSLNVYRQLVRRVDVPGFRRGKAPRAILERHVGRKALFENILEDVVPRVYEKAIAAEEIEPLARPQIEVVQEEPLVLRAVVPLPPVVTLGDYHTIRVEEVPAEVTDEAVEAVLEELRRQHATWEPVERPVQLRDLITLDVESTIAGEPFINQQGAQYQVLPELAAPAPGFAEQLVGLKTGEEKEFGLTFPADYPRQELAGKEVTFRVKVVEVKEEKLPELTDEFATQVDPEFKTVAELRDRVRQDMEKRAEERARLEFQDRAVRALVEMSTIEYPPVLVDTEIHRMLEDRERRLQMQGLTLERYLSMIGKTLEDMHEELRPEAEERVRRGLALGKLAEREGIEVSEAEVDDEVARILAEAAEERRRELEELLSTPENRGAIRERLYSRKTLDRIVAIARGGTEATVTPKEEGKE